METTVCSPCVPATEHEAETPATLPTETSSPGVDQAAVKAVVAEAKRQRSAFMARRVRRLLNRIVGTFPTTDGDTRAKHVFPSARFGV